MKSKSLNILLFALLLAACNTDEDIQLPTGKRPIMVDAGVNQNSTRTNFEGSTFTTDDSFTLYEGEPTSDAIQTVYTYDGKVWSANPVLYWDDLNIWKDGTKVTDKAVEFTAILTNGGKLNIPQTPENDYSFDIATKPISEKEVLKNDLLVAYDSKAPTLTASNEFDKVKLTFNHVMARLRIVVNDLTVVNTDNPPILGSKTKLTLEALTGNKIVFGNGTSKATTVTTVGTKTDVTLFCSKVSGQEYTYEIILPPQSLRASTLTISGNANEKDYTYNLSNVNITEIGNEAEPDKTGNLLQQGFTTTISLKIQKTGVEIGGVKVTKWVEKKSHGTATPNDYPVIDIGDGKGPGGTDPGKEIVDDYAGKTLRLTEDVTLDKFRNALGLKDDKPLGTKDTPFRGTFDGQGYKITDVNFASKEDFLGIFGYTDGATIKNLNVTGKGITNTSTSSSSATGGLVGYANNTLITNCHVDYTDSGATGVLAAYDNAGGLVGYVVGGTRIEGCSTNTKVKATHNYAGGLVGRTLARTTIRYSFAEKFDINDAYTVEASNYYAGGLIGHCIETDIEYCYSWSNVKAQRYVGGFVGRYESNTPGVTNILQYCYAAGNKIDGGNKGGMVGYVDMRSGGKPNKCYWNSVLGVGFVGLYTNGIDNSSFTLTNTPAAMNNVLATLNDKDENEPEWELTVTIYGPQTREYVLPTLLKNKGEAERKTGE